MPGSNFIKGRKNLEQTRKSGHIKNFLHLLIQPRKHQAAGFRLELLEIGKTHPEANGTHIIHRRHVEDNPPGTALQLLLKSCLQLAGSIGVKLTFNGNDQQIIGGVSMACAPRSGLHRQRQIHLTSAFLAR